MTTVSMMAGGWERKPVEHSRPSEKYVKTGFPGELYDHVKFNSKESSSSFEKLYKRSFKRPAYHCAPYPRPFSWCSVKKHVSQDPCRYLRYEKWHAPKKSYCEPRVVWCPPKPICPPKTHESKEFFHVKADSKSSEKHFEKTHYVENPKYGFDKNYDFEKKFDFDPKSGWERVELTDAKTDPEIATLLKEAEDLRNQASLATDQGAAAELMAQADQKMQEAEQMFNLISSQVDSDTTQKAVAAGRLS